MYSSNPSSRIATVSQEINQVAHELAYWQQREQRTIQLLAAAQRRLCQNALANVPADPALHAEINTHSTALNEFRMKMYTLNERKTSLEREHAALLRESFGCGR